MKILLVCFSAVAFMGCANIPVARTYSIYGSYEGAELGGSVRFEPATVKKADPKLMRPPAVEAAGPRTIDFRTERIVDPEPVPGGPLIVTRLQEGGL